MRIPGMLAIAALTAANAALTLAPANAEPADLALAKPACALADRLPSFQAPPADRPAIAEAMGADGVAVVLVSIANSIGAPMDARIHASSGNRFLDAEALRVARVARYTPGLHGCNNEGGAYLLKVDFAR